MPLPIPIRHLLQGAPVEWERLEFKQGWNPEVVDGRQVLVLWAPGGQTRPCKAKLSLAKDARDWGYFIRKGSSTVRARGADEQELISLAATVPFDDRINQRARMEDLSRDRTDRSHWQISAAGRPSRGAIAIGGSANSSRNST